MNPASQTERWIPLLDHEHLCTHLTSSKCNLQKFRKSTGGVVDKRVDIITINKPAYPSRSTPSNSLAKKKQKKSNPKARKQKDTQKRTFSLSPPYKYPLPIITPQKGPKPSTETQQVYDVTNEKRRYARKNMRFRTPDQKKGIQNETGKKERGTPTRVHSDPHTSTTGTYHLVHTPPHTCPPAPSIPLIAGK